MDNKEEILAKILSSEELEKVPVDVRDKLEKHFTERFEEFLTAKALGEAAKNNIDQVREDYERKVQELTCHVQDYEAKLEASQKNVNELREQLDSAREEISKLLEASKRYETENAECRRERNDAVDERDSLLKMIERRNIEVERLQSDVKIYETQLQSAINSKCEALAKLDEIEGKEVSLNFKEKRMEQEKTIMTNQIKSLTDDLNRTTAELQTIRRDNTMRNLELETKLNEKIEEVKIANSTIEHLNETVSSLTLKAEELAAKLLAQGEESAKMMNYYKKELDAKTKLADLYKETNDDHISQTDELTRAVTDLKKLLTDATEQYGALETKLKEIELKHEQDLEEKDNVIKSLRDEMKHANDLLKEAQEENLENAIEKLAPTAAVTTRLIKSDMSLTELYSMYVKATEELQLQKKENGHLNLQMQSILHELEEKAPVIKKQSLDYQKLREANAEILQQLDSNIASLADERYKLQEACAKIAHLERENKKLSNGQRDLARQVCYLLNEVEVARGGSNSENEQSISSDMSANEVISKKLVTFRDIKELQENNQKLILLVRDLSSKLEEMEEVQNTIEQSTYESKIANYTKRLQEMQSAQEYHTQMMNACMQQRDRYKKLYYEAKKGTNSKGVSAENIDSSLPNEEMEGIDDDVPLPSASSSVISSEAKAGKDKRVSELEEKVNDLKAQIKKIKDEYDEYRKEKLTNEKMMNEQFDSMRTELRELTSNNCKLMSTVENLSEQIQIQQKNVSTYKKQISTLEERNKNYENTIIKHEQTIIMLKDETFKCQRELASKEVQFENLKQENRILNDSHTRLQLEREALHRERQTQNVLLNNLEMIKASFERSETEGRLRMETRLDEATRECSALRRRLQEEQDRFRELSNDLKRQTETAKDRMNEEKAATDGLRDELVKLREEIIIKTKQIDDLSKKLQESLTPSKNDNPIVQANKKARDFELKYEEARFEIESLNKELQASREHAQQFCNMSQNTEKELKELHETYTVYKNQTEQELKKLRLSESNLKTRVDELETEIQLQITNEKINSNTTPVQIQKVQTELKDALQKVSELNRELRDLREENNILSSSLQSVEQKYANEMILHSSDIQQLSNVKEELSKVREQIATLKNDREKAVSELNEKQKGWEEYKIGLQTEKEEIEKRLIDLDAQNSSLHDQIQALSTKLSVASIGQAANESMNDTTITSDHNISNRSLTEDETKGNDQLLQIIKYLRKEKDIAVAKLDIIKSENARLVSEQAMTKKKLEETNSLLNNERTNSEVGAVTAARHDEILRKVETLNAITDSNRILREERDTLSTRVKELTERVTKVEDELFPLQEKNRELLARVEETSAENNSLRTEAVRWRQRANLLVERSNKNPEDFKRLQNERENLAKMLTVEKDALKQAQEELNAIKVEKTRLEGEIIILGRQIQTVTDEKKKIVDDFNSLKQQNSRMVHEIMELKNQILEKEDELKKITEDLAVRDVQLAEAKNKEFQIRKIAKRYKDSFIELKSKEEGKDSENATETENQVGGDIAGTSKQDYEKELKDKINELNAQITALQEENENLRKEHESLKANSEKEERNRQLLKEAKARIMNLTESKNSVARELTITKAQLQTLEQNREEHDIAISGLKQQYESRISRLEKEHSEQEKELKETMTRISRENETLMLRINQLHRQLGMQQTSKPSTSSGQSSDKSPTETPRTANVKPMSGPSGQQSATVTPWRGGETPLASIRPMSVQNSRTAAVLPTSQTSNVAAIQGSSSSGSVTALVPPQQQVHTTGNSSGEAMSSSPTSSHTDYMPATSSAAVVVATIPPMGANAESSQEAESVQNASNESTSSSQVLVSGGQQQQAVALVSPRVEGTAQNLIPPQSAQAQETNQPSTSGTSSTSSSSSSSNVSVSSHHQASSSNTVTTTQAGGHKRPRDVEGDSSTSNEDPTEKSQQNKRTRLQVGEATFQGVTESGLDVEYQVPTSSQRDQEDDIIIVDSEDDGMADEGPADADDGPMEDEADNGEGYEMEESYEQEQEIDEGEGPDIDEDNVQSDNNEVEVDDSNEVPNQSGTSSSNNHVAPDAGTSAVVDQSSSDQTPENQEVQQIQAISSGSNEAGSSSQATPQTSCWRQGTPLSRQQQATYLMLQQGYEETGDDGIVPSTPTLYGPRRADGSSEAVSSPHSQVPHAARFTFSESTSTTRTTSSTGVGPGSNIEGLDDTRIDLSEDLDGHSVPSTPQQTSPQRDTDTVIVEGSSSTSEKPEQPAGSSQEAVAGPSHIEGQIPEITVTTAAEDADVGDDATTSDANDGGQLKMEDDDIEEEEDEEGLDGVTSEGEKPSGGNDEPVEIEEGREAEASSSPTVNTRSRSTRGTPSMRRNNRSNHQRSNRPTPIIWQDHSRSGRNINQNVRGSNEGNMPRGPFQQRGNRARRMRRPTGQHFGGNMRY